MRQLAFIIILCFLSACKTETTTNEVKIKENITVSEAAELSKKGYLYVDLRTQKEIDETGIIGNAMHIDYRADDYKSKLSQLSKESNYLLYCRSGGRSSNALKDFRQMGLTAYNVLGGYTEWEKQNISQQ